MDDLILLTIYAFNDLLMLFYRSCDVFDLIVPISYFMLEGRKDPGKIGMLYLCTFTLLKLSGERNFGVQLNKPYQVRRSFVILVLSITCCLPYILTNNCFPISVAIARGCSSVHRKPHGSLGHRPAQTDRIG